MGLTKGQPGGLHQYFCRVLEQIASHALTCRWGVLGGRQLEAAQVRNVGSIQDDTAKAA
jgi:hypothetical protein